MSINNELRDRIASIIWDHLRPIEDTTPIADSILSLPEIAEALRITRRGEVDGVVTVREMTPEEIQSKFGRMPPPD